MPSYLHPGVYMEEVPSGARPIESVGTSTAAIMGFATKGPDNEPILIFSWKEYQEQFGGIVEHSSGDIDYMGHTVQAFFENGGGKAYICRVSNGHGTAKGTMFFPGDPALALDGINFEVKSSGKWGNDIIVSIEKIDNTPNPETYTVRIYKQTDMGRELLEEYPNRAFDPANPQSFADSFAAENSEYIIIKDVVSSVLPTPTFPMSGEEFKDEGVTPVIALSGLDFASQNFTLKLDGASAVTSYTFPTTIDSNSTLTEIANAIQDLVRTSGNSETFTCQVHLDGDKLIFSSGSQTASSKVEMGPLLKTRLGLGPADNLSGKSGIESFNDAYQQKSLSIASGGNDGQLSTSKDDYSSFLDQLKNFRDVNIILLPGHAYTGASSIGIVDAAIGHATSMGNRMVIVDPPQTTLLKSANDVAGFGPPTSEYSALYYPWMQVVNPNYDVEKNNTVPTLYYIPPSGFAAGLWARTDGVRGVWKAPAGVGATVFGALRPEYVVGNDEQDQLNPEGVNCIRKILTQPVIWGARTLATRAVPEKRYVPVQRTTLMIKESIYQGIQWAVFEPNDHNLWASLRLNIEAFMDGLHRAGAFQGEKASDAYFVRCGLGQTMTQGDIDAGRVIVEVGFAPLKPAEFVIVRLSQKTAQ